MNPEPLNVIMLGFILVVASGCICLAYSPEALEKLGRKMRARASAVIAARKAFAQAQRDSLDSYAWGAREVETMRLEREKFGDRIKGITDNGR